MFHRLQLEEWHAIFKSIGFALFFPTFILMLLRALFAPRKEVNEASALPLEKETSKEAHAHRQ